MGDWVIAIVLCVTGSIGLLVECVWVGAGNDKKWEKE